MDGNELTPWEELGPTKGSGEQQPPHSQSLTASTSGLDIYNLEPATTGEIVSELTPCLALVAPTGMSQSDRDEWLMAAGQTLQESGLPTDLLKRGCKAARHNPKVDHPSRIIAAIMEDVNGSMKFRRGANSLTTIPESHRVKPRYCTPEEASAILAEYGLRSAFTA